MMVNLIYSVICLYSLICLTFVEMHSTAVESCMQIYTVPKETVVCEPSFEVNNTIKSLQEKTEQIQQDMHTVNHRINTIDPSVANELPEDLKASLHDISNIKLTQDTHKEILHRLENLITNATESLEKIEYDAEDDVNTLIEQQSELIAIALENTNKTIHEEYVKRVTYSHQDVIANLQQLELDFEVKVRNINTNLYGELKKESNNTRDLLSEMKDKWSNTVSELENRLKLESRLRVGHYNETSRHGDLIDNLQIILQNVRKNKEKCEDNQNIQGNQVEELQTGLTVEKNESKRITKEIDTLQNTIEELQSNVLQLEQEVAHNTNLSFLMREKLNSMDSDLMKIEHLIPKDLKVRDCQDALKFYFQSSGVYSIKPHPTTESIEVYCDMDTEDQGWTVIQRRQNGNVDFFNDWNDYKQGFGDVTQEHWLGLHNIHSMTMSRNYILRVELEDWENNWYWAEYGEFYLENEQNKYILHVDNYKGNAGDSLSYHNGMAFSTRDHDNDLHKEDVNCALVCRGGWWYNGCSESNLNGQYYNEGSYVTISGWGDGIIWKSIRTTNLYSMKSSIMKIRPTYSTI